MARMQFYEYGGNFYIRAEGGVEKQVTLGEWRSYKELYTLASNEHEKNEHEAVGGDGRFHPSRDDRDTPAAGTTGCDGG